MHVIKTQHDRDARIAELISEIRRLFKLIETNGYCVRLHKNVQDCEKELHELRETMVFDGQILRNSGMFSGIGVFAPRYENPTYKNAYIKILDFVSNEGETTMKDCLTNLFNGSNFDTFKMLANYGFLECVNPDAKRNKMFRISNLGKTLLDKAKWSKPVYDLIDFVKKTKCTSIEELNLTCTLYGEMRFLDSGFKKQARCICLKSKPAMNALSRFKFLRVFLDFE